MSGPFDSPREAVPILLAAAASVLLFYSGLFAFLFAVPVQVVFTRHGGMRGLTAAGGTAAAIVVVHLLQVLRIDDASGGVLQLLLLDSLMPVGLLTGIAVFNLWRRYPWWARLLAGGAVGVVGAIPSLRILMQAGDGTGPLSQQLATMVEMLGVGENADAFVAMVTTVALSTIGVGMVSAVAANSWIGRSIVLRRYGLAQSLRPARVPDDFVWLVIAGLALVIGSWIGQWNRIGPVGWNVLLVGAFLFGIQGVGLVQHLLRRRGLPEGSERWVVTVTLALLFLPGVNVAVLVGVPLLGMSEVWIDYKRGDEYEGHSER